MITTILPIERQHYEAMYELYKLVEPWDKPHYYDKFCTQMKDRQGFTVWKGQDNLIGYCTFSDFIPGHNIIAHLSFHPKHKSLTFKMLRTFFHYAFVDLEVPRITSYSIDKLTDTAGLFLKRLGFIEEGVLRQAGRFSHGIYDIRLWAMLKEECKWIK